MDGTPPFWATMSLDERALALRAAAHRLISAPESAVRRIGYVMLQAVLDGDPKRLPADLGLVTRGGVHGLKQAQALDWRDRELQRLASAPSYDGMTLTQIARSMISSFQAYERRAWPRHRDAGVLPGTDPERIWNSLLMNQTRIPRSVWRVREIITPKHPFGREGEHGT